MVRLIPGLLVTVLVDGAVVADDGFGSIRGWPLWGVAFLNFFLTGWLLGWLLARLTPNWGEPAFACKCLNYFGRPVDGGVEDG